MEGKAGVCAWASLGGWVGVTVAECLTYRQWLPPPPITQHVLQVVRKKADAMGGELKVKRAEYTRAKIELGEASATLREGRALAAEIVSRVAAVPPPPCALCMSLTHHSSVVTGCWPRGRRSGRQGGGRPVDEGG